MPEILEFIKYVIIFDIAFIITSLFTLHFPSWKIAKTWAKDVLEEKDYPSKKYILSHTLVYILVTFFVFPFVLLLVLLNNKEAIVGYSKSIIKGLQEDVA